MNLIYAADSWNILHWIILILGVGFVFLWVTGNRKLNIVEERIFRIELFDTYYEYPGGFLLLQLRNVAVVTFLIIVFKLL